MLLFVLENSIGKENPTLWHFTTIIHHHIKIFIFRRCEECSTLLTNLEMLVKSQAKRIESGMNIDDHTTFSHLSKSSLVTRCQNLTKELKKKNKLSNYWKKRACIFANTVNQNKFLFAYVTKKPHLTRWVNSVISKILRFRLSITLTWNIFCCVVTILLVLEHFLFKFAIFLMLFAIFSSNLLILLLLLQIYYFFLLFVTNYLLFLLQIRYFFN